MVCTFNVCYLYRDRGALVMRTGALEQDGGIQSADEESADKESPRMKFSWSELPTRVDVFLRTHQM